MTQSLQTLLEHAERERDEGLAALQQAGRLVQDLQAQASQLAVYRDEYDARHPARGGRGPGPAGSQPTLRLRDDGRELVDVERDAVQAVAVVTVLEVVASHDPAGPARQHRDLVGRPRGSCLGPERLSQGLRVLDDGGRQLTPSDDAPLTDQHRQVAALTGWPGAEGDHR